MRHAQIGRFCLGCDDMSHRIVVDRPLNSRPREESRDCPKTVRHDHTMVQLVSATRLRVYSKRVSPSASALARPCQCAGDYLFRRSRTAVRLPTPERALIRYPIYLSATRRTFIASVPASMSPLSSLGQPADEATQFDPVTIRYSGDLVGYVPTRSTLDLSADCKVSKTVDVGFRVLDATNALYAETGHCDPQALIAKRRTCEVSLRMKRRERIATACLTQIQAMTTGEDA